MIQEGKENPAFFHRQHVEGFRMYTNIDPSTCEGQSLSGQHFISLSTPDIRKKLQKLQLSPQTPTPQLLSWLWPLGYLGFPGDTAVKNSPANAGDIRGVGLIPVLGRSPGGGNGNPLQYPCLENPRNRGAWQATVHEVRKSWTRLRMLAHHK